MAKSFEYYTTKRSRLWYNARVADEVLTYSVLSGSALSDADWAEVSELFSTSYGVYSEKEPSGRAGRRIRLSPSYYRRAYANESYQIAVCRDGKSLVAEAVFRVSDTTRGRAAFVVQLVVDERCRRRGIASTLLHAIWGFSDFCCWGIVTSNAFTVESLEAATFRRVRPQTMLDNVEFIRREVLAGIEFLEEALWTISASESVVDTGFYTDRSAPAEAVFALSERLGALPEGAEWLAVVFREQPLDDFKAYRSLILSSARFVAEAYARMPQDEQGWAAKADAEISAILGWIPELPRTARVADFGAGSGRHVTALRAAGFTDLTAIDFASSAPGIVREDVRTWRAQEPFDLILCLYDVIGSFPDDEDNKAILASVSANLKPGGHAVLSVSNYDYVAGKGAGKVDLDNPVESVQKIFALPPSRSMETTGEFFNPNFILLDEKRHVACRKEQFSARSGLPGEYLLCDRRFTADEIRAWAEACGLAVTEVRFVRAGFDAEFDASTGKEILLITKRT